MLVVFILDKDPVGDKPEAGVMAKQEGAKVVTVAEVEVGTFTLVPTHPSSGHPCRMRINNE